jgi:GNAT superfamily N-acetyltransferase
MSIIIKEINNTKLLRKFIDFPLKLYKDNPYYVPSLKTDEINTLHWDRNPAFDYCEARYWLAYRDNKIVGRVAAIINHKHINKWDQPYLRFGWLDFVDDLQVSTSLMKTVEYWARELYLSAVHGPLGFTDLDREGLLIDGFDEVATMATLYNYSYYPVHLKQLGYQKDIDWIEYELTVPKKLDHRITKAADIVLERNHLHMLRTQHKRELLNYALQLFQLINQEYSHLYGSTALSERDIQHYTKTYFNFVHPDFVPVVLDEENQMIAFGVVIPSLSRALQKSHGHLFPLGWFHLMRALKKNDRADLYLIAVKKKYQGLGVNMVLMNHVYQVFNERGIEKVETNPELETNLDVQSQWKFIKKRQHKRRRCYIKRL